MFIQALIPKTFAGLCKGANSLNSSIVLSTSSVIRQDSLNILPPCTTRCPIAEISSKEEADEILSSLEDTYGDAGWVDVEFANGAGLETVLLPGSVVDMLNANSSNVYFQRSNDGTKVRIIGVVDLTEEELENFAMLGFDVTMKYNGNKYTKTFTTSIIYTSLMVDGEPVEASEYNGTYFYAIEINGLDAAASDVVFDVTGIAVHTGSDTEHAFGSRTYTVSAS